MKKESLSRLRKPLHILLSASLVVAGLCLMGACLSIYRSGDQPFTRESVAAAFGPISIPVYLCLGLIVISFLAEHLLPRPEEKKPTLRQTRMILGRMQEKIDLDLCDRELREQVTDLRHKRKLLDRVTLTVLILSSILFLTYGMNSRNFHQTRINESMVRAMFWLLPCCAAPFFCGIYAARKNLTSMDQELALLKTAPKEAKIAPPKPRNNRRRNMYLRTGILLLAVLFLIGGFFAGGTKDVLTKAVNICTECVGLG